MKPTILFVHSNAELYGADFILLQTVAGLKDHFASIVAVPGEGPLTERLRAEGIEVVLTGESVLRRSNLAPTRLLAFAFALLRDTLRLRALIKARAVTMVYSNTAAVVAGSLAARLTRVPHLYHIHEIILSPAWFAKRIARHVLRTSDLVVAVSNAVRDQLERFRRPGDARVQVIYNGIAEPVSHSEDVRRQLRAEFGVTDTDVLVGVIGRIHPWKGQGYFIDAAADVAARSPHARFVIIGGTFTGYEWLLEELATRVRDRGLTDRFSILPHRTDISNVMNALDIFVLPSTLPDPLPTVVLEAMSAGRAVVATAHGGALEMVEEGVTGFTAPFDNAASFASRILTLIADPELRASMGNAGRSRQRSHFSRERFLAEMQTTILGLNARQLHVGQGS